MGQCGSAMGGAEVQTPPLSKQQQAAQTKPASTRRSSKHAQQVAHSSPKNDPPQRERSRNSCNWAIGGPTAISSDGNSSYAFFSGLSGLNNSSNLSGPGTAPSSNTSAISISAVGSPNNIASFTSRPPHSSTNGQQHTHTHHTTQQQTQQQQHSTHQPQQQQQQQQSHMSHHHRVKSESQQLPLVAAAGSGGSGGGGSFVTVNPRPAYSTTHSRVSSTGVAHYAPVSSSKILLASPTSHAYCFQGAVDPPMDCTEVEHYYDDDCAEYLDYVRRWEEQKDAEARATEADPVRGERSLFFGLAKLHQQQWEAAVVACHNKQQSSKLLLSAELAHQSSAAAAADNQFTLELPGSNMCSPRDALSTILTPRSPALTTLSVGVAPTVPHIAQTSMLSFMAELIAESNALATAAASRVSSPIPATRTLVVATTHGLVSYPSSVQGSPTARHGHLRTYSNARQPQHSPYGPQGSVMSLSPPSSDCITTTRRLRSNSMQHSQHPIAAAC